ncbi:MAG: HDIG domain-containing protein [Psychrilyobacter sp.]|nr:HDIG domain-containing protein [Psychrilyobacter sp.]
MKKIKIFGRKLTIEFEKKDKASKKKNNNNDNRNKDTEISDREVVKRKILYLLLILMITVLSANTYIFESKLKLGDLATTDLVAPTDIIYKDRVAKEKIISKMLADYPKIYIKIDGVREESIKEVKLFFNYIRVNKFRNVGEAYEREDQYTNIPYKEFSYLFKKTAKELTELEREYITNMNTLYKNGIKKDENVIMFNNSFEELPVLDVYEEGFMRAFLKPNYILDVEKTKKMLKEKVTQLEDVTIRIKAGTIILKKGEVVSPEKVSILKHLGLYGNTSKVIKLFGTFLYLVILSTIFRIVGLKFIFKEIRNRNSYSAILILILVGILTLRFITPTWKYILPIESIFILLGILINIRTSLIIGIFLILFSIPLNGYNIEYLIVEILSLIISLYLVTKIKNRTNIINAGVYIGVAKVFIVLSIAVAVNMEFIDSIIRGGLVLLSGVLTGMLTIALLPYFERTFNILTDMKLLELGDLSHPLLRKLSIEAPGTFHHSMMVATLSEQATEIIGGNSALARVASYYHDIGKMKRPQFYVENQSDGINPHNNLTPTMSTLVITSHTKDGDEMGREHNIPKEIRDIMYEHQGTTLLAYFYNKARQENPGLNENDFRYSGPKPRSKESAVIMLADSIEAAVRSIDNKTPVTIEKMIRKIIDTKIEAQQLSDADLTFKEIEIIIKSFTKVLMSIHHVRLKYPGQK